MTTNRDSKPSTVRPAMARPGRSASSDVRPATTVTIPDQQTAARRAGQQSGECETGSGPGVPLQRLRAILDERTASA